MFVRTILSLLVAGGISAAVVFLMSIAGQYRD
jgi:hypothetical protein